MAAAAIADVTASARMRSVFANYQNFVLTAGGGYVRKSRAISTSTPGWVAISSSPTARSVAVKERSMSSRSSAGGFDEIGLYLLK